MTQVQLLICYYPARDEQQDDADEPDDITVAGGYQASIIVGNILQPRATRNANTTMTTVIYDYLIQPTDRIEVTFAETEITGYSETFGVPILLKHFSGNSAYQTVLRSDTNSFATIQAQIQYGTDILTRPAGRLIRKIGQTTYYRARELSE